MATAEPGLLPPGRSFSGLTRVRFIRFLAVGALNTAFGYGVFAVVYLATARHNLAVVVATGLGILFNFATTGRLVFGNRSWRKLLPFALAYGAALALNLVALN